MANTNPWQLIHRYQYLARIGQARPFLCPQCNNKVAFIPDANDNPIMWCTHEDMYYVPGSVFWGDVRAVVTEFYLE